eukprot:6711187-Prymnesium_polylepis.1
MGMCKNWQKAACGLRLGPRLWRTAAIEANERAALNLQTEGRGERQDERTAEGSAPSAARTEPVQGVSVVEGSAATPVSASDA